MRRFLTLVLISLVFASCEDVIDVDLNDAAPRLVIDARLELLENGTSRNTVKLTRSSGFFEEENPTVTTATVTVIDNNNITHSFTYNTTAALYVNNTLDIQPAVDYELVVIDGNDSYRGVQRLVTSVPLEGVEETEITGFGDDLTEITVFFTDPPTPGDNYLFTYRDPENIAVETSDDQFINGNRTPASFFIEELQPGTPITFTITGLDATGYRFFETLIQQTDDAGGGPFDTQPATVRGNIINPSNPDRFPFGYFRVSQVFELDYTSQ